MRLIIFCVCFLLYITPAHAQTQPEQITRIGRGDIRSIDWYPDDSRILVSTVTGAWIYSREFEDIHHIPNAYLATLSPDGRYIAGVDDDARIQLWDAQTFELLGFEADWGYFRRVDLVVWSPDGRYLAASGRNDEDVAVAWELTDYEHSKLYFRAKVDQLIWNPDATQVALINDATGEIWTIAFGQNRILYRKPDVHFTDALTDTTAVWKNPTQLLFQWFYDSLNFDVFLFDTTTDTTAPVLRTPTAGEFAYQPGGDLLAIGQSHTAVWLQDANETQYRIDLMTPETFTTTVVWSGDGRWLAVGTSAFEENAPVDIMIVDATTKELAQQFTFGQKSIQTLRWSHDNRFLLVHDSHHRLGIYEADSGETISISNGHTFVGNVAVWNPMGTQIAAADTIDGVYLWDAQTGSNLFSFFGHTTRVTQMKWQPKGDLLATWAGKRYFSAIAPTFRLWNTVDGTPVSLVPMIGRDIYAFDWSPDGHQLAGAISNYLYIWDLQHPDASRRIVTAFDFYSAEELQWHSSGRYIALIAYMSNRTSIIVDITSDEILRNRIDAYRGDFAWLPDSTLIHLLWRTPGDWTPIIETEPLLLHDDLELGVHMDAPRLVGLIEKSKNVFLSPQGSYAIAIDVNDNGIVWDTESRQPVFMLADSVDLVWSSDESKAAVLRRDGSIWILDSVGQVQTVIPSPPVKNETDGLLIWSPFGDMLAYVHDGVLDVWKVA